MTDTDRAGVVLAGGYSTRFGDREKALVEVGGDPMLERVVVRLGRAVDTVVVNCRADQRADFARVLDGHPVRFALDEQPDGGPLVGLRTALEGIHAAYTAVVACDMPGVDPDFLAVLFERAAGRDGAVPALRDGHRQPAQAVYRTAAMVRAADRQLDAERRSLHGALEHLDVAVVPADEVAEHTDWHSLSDVNTPAELESFEDATRGRE